MVRKAEDHDIQALIDMGLRFHRASKQPGVFSPGTFGVFCSQLINNDEGCLFRSDHGMIGGFISRPPWDSTYRIADEAFWWSEDGAGPALMQAYEEWAAENADETRMGCLTNMRFSAVAGLLSRRGYKAVEMGMVKQ